MDMPIVRVFVPKAAVEDRETLQRILPRITGKNYSEALNALSALAKSGCPLTFEVLATSTST